MQIFYAYINFSSCIIHRILRIFIIYAVSVYIRNTGLYKWNNTHNFYRIIKDSTWWTKRLKIILMCRNIYDFLPLYEDLCWLLIVNLIPQNTYFNYVDTSCNIAKFLVVHNTYRYKYKRLWGQVHILASVDFGLTTDIFEVLRCMIPSNIFNQNIPVIQIL